MSNISLIFKTAEFGMTTGEVLRTIVSSNRAIQTLYYFRYQTPPLLQKRLSLTSGERRVVQRAKLLRGKTHLPFWDALLLSCFDRNGAVPRLLNAAAFHQVSKNCHQSLSRKKILKGAFLTLSHDYSRGSISVASRVRLSSGRTRHLPFLDFHCPESKYNDVLVKATCRRLFSGGVLIFASGESYHAIGLQLLKEDDFLRFLSFALLYAPIVDSRYIAHQLLEGACALRINSSDDKPQMPALKFILRKSFS